MSLQLLCICTWCAIYMYSVHICSVWETLNYMSPEKQYLFKIFNLEFYALIPHLICDVLFNMNIVTNYTSPPNIYRCWSLKYELQSICNYFVYYHYPLVKIHHCIGFYTEILKPSNPWTSHLFIGSASTDLFVPKTPGIWAYGTGKIFFIFMPTLPRYLIVCQIAVIGFYLKIWRRVKIKWEKGQENWVLNNVI